MRFSSYFKDFEGLWKVFFLFIIALSTGIVGFMYIENMPLIDATYLAVITLSTVGFDTLKPLSNNGKIFSIFFIIFNISIFTYALSVVSKYFFDGKFKEKINAIIMQEKLNNIKNHVIVCGAGRNGRQALEVLKNNAITTVLIDKNESKKEGSHSDFFIHGDSTNDEILLDANIKTAKSIIVALPNDAENLFTVLSARQLNPTIKIISRASQDTTRKKLKLAGADNVILPEHIGGAYMASLVFASDIKEFLDILSNSNNANFKMKEINNQLTISLRSIDAWKNFGANIIGIKNSDNSYIMNPGPDFEINKSHKIIAIGSEAEIAALEKKLN